MSKRPYTVLNGQTRQLVFSVYSYMKRTTEQRSRTYLMDVYKKTAEATNISSKTVTRIVKQAEKSDFVFRTPKRKITHRPVTGIDSFDRGVIRRCIHKYHVTNNEIPTLAKLHQKLQADINYQGSTTSLRRIIRELGFKFRKMEKNGKQQKLMIEQSHIRYQRIVYLESIQKYRAEGRPIIYCGESYIDSSHSAAKTSTDGAPQPPKKQISRVERAIIVHAANDSGFMPNALLIFKAGTKSVDFHDIMDHDNYEEWLSTQLLPNIPEKSVLVVDNAPHHNKQYEPAPTFNANLAEMMEWLKQKEIPFEETMQKPELYNLIHLNKDKYKQFNIDRILTAQGHTVVRLPPCHPDLNPMEMAWANIRGYVGEKNVTFSLDSVMGLIKERVELMCAAEWWALCQIVRNIEDEYQKYDCVIDELTENFIFCVNDMTSSDEDDSDSERKKATSSGESDSD